MRYLLDTDWLLDVIGGRARAANIIEELGPDALYVSIVSHGELFEGVFDFPNTDVRLRELYTFLEQYETLPLTDPIMETFGRTRSHPRKSGQMIADLDLSIAATAISHHLTLLTRIVRHFRRPRDLQLYTPS